MGSSAGVAATEAGLEVLGEAYVEVVGDAGRAEEVDVVEGGHWGDYGKGAGMPGLVPRSGAAPGRNLKAGVRVSLSRKWATTQDGSALL